MKLFEWPRQREAVERFFTRSSQPNPTVERSVERIIESVRREGDRAVARWTLRFDGLRLRPEAFEVPEQTLKAAWRAQPADLRAALRLAARRIELFHRRQVLRGFRVRDPALGWMEQRVAPVERVGIYAPGGKAAYPSTVLMNAIPARVAGVDEIILATPPGPDGNPHPAVLAAARLAGVHRVFRIGGAQALAALAFGTATIPRVDKLVGPGNVYVAAAKRRLFGQVDIDAVAGPTELMILADASAPIPWVAADLLAQAEHDEAASAGVVFVGGDRSAVAGLRRELRRQAGRLPRRRIAEKALARNGYVIHVRRREEAVEIANRRAPEHLEIMTREAGRLARGIRHAGALFIGRYSAEAVGDYLAGPNHTLPTGGTARFFSPLGVWTFCKTSHAIKATAAGLRRLGPATTRLADAEGLAAHAESVRIRLGRGR